MFGYSDKEIVGQSITYLIPSDRMNEELEIVKKLQQGLHVTHFETVRKCKDGAVIDVSLSISPILVVNARDAMPDGGKLTIETANVELSEAYCLAYADLKPGHYAMLAVNDTGHGMDAKVKTRLCEPFFTTKPQGKGTGLGLATVFGVVKQSNGHIEVYTEVGRGTTFKIYIPQTQEVAGASATESQLTMPAGKEVILVVEDEEAIRELIRDLLEMIGYSVLMAANGKEAISVCAAHKEAIDLVITDVVMPEMGGPELVRHIKISHPKTKVLFTSGYTDHAIVRNGELEAGVAFIQKPFTPANLARKVRNVLDKV